MQAIEKYVKMTLLFVSAGIRHCIMNAFDFILLGNRVNDGCDYGNKHEIVHSG